MIIDFLQKSVRNKKIHEEFIESIDVAIDCIGDVFDVDKKNSVHFMNENFEGKDLLEVINLFLSAKAECKISKNEIDSSSKKKANNLKEEGNKAMTAKNFDLAIEKYSSALELDPENVIFLSNRAAAYSSMQKYENAIEDSQKAIKINPNYSKAYSRLGLAMYALGRTKEAFDSYKKGMDIEGDKKSDAMVKGYNTAKRKMELELESSVSEASNNIETVLDKNEKGEGSGASGMPDLPNMFKNGMPDLSNMFKNGMPSFNDMMSNPEIMSAAQKMMSNSDALKDLMKNPSIRQMAQNFGLKSQADGSPDLSGLSNNPMFSKFMNSPDLDKSS